MIKVTRTITEQKIESQSIWTTTRKVYVCGILVYNYQMTEQGYNDKKNDIGFQGGYGHILPTNRDE